jgi:hypothetical protein
MGGAPCNVEPARRVRWRRLARRRRELLVVRLGGGVRRARGFLRRWLSRAARWLAAIYMAALTGPPAPPGASCPPWIGLEPCFATPFVASTKW